jgi:hypothetical protein
LDVERRSLVIALASAFALVWSPFFRYGIGIGNPEIVMFVVTTLALGLSVILASLVIVPRIASRLLPARYREREVLFEAAVAGFVIGIVVMAAQAVELAVRAFGESPYD